MNQIWIIKQNDIIDNFFFKLKGSLESFSKSC